MRGEAGFVRLVWTGVWPGLRSKTALNTEVRQLMSYLKQVIHDVSQIRYKKTQGTRKYGRSSHGAILYAAADSTLLRVNSRPHKRELTSGMSRKEAHHSRYRFCGTPEYH